jgi:hypothetical protein
MKNTTFFCLFLVVLIFLSGCKPIIEKKHVFNPPDEEIPATTNGSGHVFVDKGVMFTFGIMSYGRSRYETDQNIIYEWYGPYKAILVIKILPGDKKTPTNIKVIKGNVTVFKKDGSMHVFDLTQVENKPFKQITKNRGKPNERYNFMLSYRDKDSFQSFISENVIHAETEKVVCDVEFDVEYATGLVKTYRSEIVQVPYYQEREASRAEFF